MRKLLVLFLLANLACAAEPPITLEWSKPVIRGIHRTDFLDLNGDGTVEVYAVSLDPTRTTIYVYDLSGGDMYDTVVPRHAQKTYGDEDVVSAAVADFEKDGFLDIVSTTEIVAAAVNNHRVYRFQRIPEEGLDRLYNRFAWTVKDTGLVTSLNLADVDADGTLDIVTSSVDYRIRAYSADGEVKTEYVLNGSVWDAVPVEVGNDSSPEYLAACFRGLYLVNDNSVALIDDAEERFDIAYAADVDGDELPELYGVRDNTILAYDLHGALLWSYGLDNVADLDSMDIRGSDSYLVAAAEKTLTFFDPEGSAVWTHDTGSRINSLDTLDEPSMLYVGTVDGLQVYGVNEEYFRRIEARGEYEKALSNMASDGFNLSLQHAKRAAELYRSLGLVDNQTAAEELAVRAGQLLEARELYLEAERHYNAGRYNLSVEYAGRALDMYRSLGYDEGVNRSMELGLVGGERAEEIIAYAGRRETADEHYALAEALYVNGSFRESVEYARMALEEYGEIGYGEGVSQARMLVSLNQGLVSETTTTMPPTTSTLPERGLETDDIAFYGILGLAAAIVAAAAIWSIKNR